MLRALAHRFWAYVAVLWLTTLISWIVWIVLLHIGIVGPPLFEEGEPKDARYWPLFWADRDLHFWANICFHWTTGLGTYLNTVTLPWRLSIGLHLWGGGLCSGRSSEAGQDFYGRPTEAIWFHIPRRPRGVVTSCLLASTFFHYTMQVFRLVYYDYEGLTGPAGTVLVNVPFGISTVLGIAGGIVQGGAEKRLMKDAPEKWPPGVGDLVKDALRAIRAGELSLSMLGGWLNARKLESALNLLNDAAHMASDAAYSAASMARLTAADSATPRGEDGASGEDGALDEDGALGEDLGADGGWSASDPGGPDVR